MRVLTRKRSQLIRKAQPTPSQVHVNVPLTNVSVAYMIDSGLYIASRVFPVVPVLQ
jgi:hypothetical protein